MEVFSRSFLVAFFLGLIAVGAAADPLVQWNFNFPLSATNDVSDNTVLTINNPTGNNFYRLQK